MDYEIVLDKFSGPLDLLLHLIRKQELNIHDIPIALVTDQYLAYLHAMEELSLDIASEFLVMAATLLAIKSRMLLPRVKAETEEEVSLDPRAELIEQLLEYQRAKWAADQLREREQLQSLVFTREPENLTPYAPTEPQPVTGVTLWNLVDAYRSLLRKVPKQQQSAEIRGHVVSVDAMMETMLERLQVAGTCSFSQLLQFVRTRAELVTGFLALLELVKNRIVICVQTNPFAEIDITLGEPL